jgi:uncharacterized protein YegJ (DUF2314 family)
MITLHRNDDGLGRATARARRTFRYFLRELSWERRRVVPAYTMMLVKAAFPMPTRDDPEYGEHMWLEHVEFDGTTVSGTLVNDSYEPSDYSAGDRVEVSFEEQMSDWLIASDDAVYGAYTVHLIRSRMSDEERTLHDEQWDLPFGPPSLPKLPNATSETDETDHPMALATVNHVEAELRDHPAQLRSLDARGWTWLHDEVLSGNAAIVEILLRHGADREAKTPDGLTPLALATTWGWSRIAAMLRAPAISAGPG